MVEAKPKRQLKARHVAGAGAIAGALAIATPLVTNFEGERTKAYRDVVGIPTVCVGETKNVHMGDVHTHAECQAMLAGRLQEFAEGVYSCVTVPMSGNRAAASISLAYNIGVGAFCHSSYVKALNAGEPDACDRMLAWDRAGGREIDGLKRRREAERKLCKS
jgi:lysozyme